MSSVSPAGSTSVLARLWREPLLQFLVLGALIFAVAEWRARASDDSRHTIVVDAATLRYLQNLYQVQYGVGPDAATLQFLVDNHVREEVLFREAMQLGLAQDDEIIRRRLVQKMEFLLEDGRESPVADAATLHTWYEQHADKYRTEAQATFEHLYFSPDAAGDEAARQRAAALLASGGDLQAGKGDHFPLPFDSGPQDAGALRQVFGDSALTAAVFTVTPGTWQGPFRSGLGWHLLKVTSRSEAGVQPYDAVADQVQADWLDAERKMRASADLQRLLAAYKVVQTQ